MKNNEWQPIATAPKDGTIIEINYTDGGNAPNEICLAVWSERPVCMLGSRNGGFPPGWATAGGQTDNNLPLDEPICWREI